MERCAGQRRRSSYDGSGSVPTSSEVRYPGFGGMISHRAARTAGIADLVQHSTELWVYATSLGGVESTLERRRRWKSEPATIPDGLIRLSVGIEDVEDLWEDLVQALDAAHRLTSGTIRTPRRVLHR